MKTGVEIIAEERKRQIEVEKWKPHHDDVTNAHGELANAAAAYALHPLYSNRSEYWPFHESWWKPSPDNRIRELAKAGALIAAEIDRLQRIKAKEGQTNE